MKHVLKIFIIILIIVVGLLLGRNFIAKIAIENGIKSITGLQLKLGSLDIGLTKSSAGIKNLKIYNPKGYQERIMLDMPEIYVNYDRGDILRNKMHFNEVRINLKEFIVVRNANRELNLDSLKALQSKKADSKEPKEKGAAPKLLIDRLDLTIGKVIYKDFSDPQNPTIKEFNININERYTNISNPNALVKLIVFKALTKTSIASLTGFDVNLLDNELAKTLGSARKIATIASETLKETTEAAKKTATILSETAQELGDSLGLPLGGK